MKLRYVVPEAKQDGQTVSHEPPITYFVQRGSGGGGSTHLRNAGLLVRVRTALYP
jgi:hypothetical protein